MIQVFGVKVNGGRRREGWHTTAVGGGLVGKKISDPIRKRHMRKIKQMQCKKCTLL